MTDKVQRIREFLVGIAEADGVSTILANAIEKKILPYIDSLQEEPIYTDFTKALAECIHQAQCNVFGPLVHAEIWKDELIKLAKSEEPVSEQNLSNVERIGKNWKEELFEKNRLKHCNSITNEQAELEQGFIDEHLDKHQRMPTFLDAIEYGMKLIKEQLMTKAIDGEVGYWNLRGLSVNVELPRSVNEGDMVKVIVIKED